MVGEGRPTMRVGVVEEHLLSIRRDANLIPDLGLDLFDHLIEPDKHGERLAEKHAILTTTKLQQLKLERGDPAEFHVKLGQRTT